jgi:adenosylcobinamide-phosphate synthase
MHSLSLIAVVALDVSLGDPRWLPHPVRWIGRLIAFCERHFYPGRRSAGREFFAGCVVCVFVVVMTVASGLLFLIACQTIAPWCAVTGEIIIGFYCLSARSLAQEAGRVFRHLESGDIVPARKALSMIVGRDTEHLDEQGITRATVETVAENITDGIVSPLFYYALGGPLVALAFKAASTMDSMIGYKNERYLHFGTCAARLDDALNFIPARITGFVLIPLAAAMFRFDARQSVRIVKRDRLKHESPNSAHGEAAVAGALGIQLGGEATYQGIVAKKDILGDPRRDVEPHDILRAINILYGVTVLSTVIAIVGLLLYRNVFLS